MTEVEEKETLDILNQVRSMLSKAFEEESNCTPKSFSNPIATDYPIKSIKNQGEFKFHGWCEIETQGGWVRKLNVEKPFEIFYIIIMIRGSVCLNIIYGIHIE